jgi:hypothetical protein
VNARRWARTASVPLATVWSAHSDIFALEAICGTEVCGGDGTSLGTVSMQVNTVPEPVAITLLGTGLIGLAAVRRRRAA